MSDDDACARRCSIDDGTVHRTKFFCARILGGKRMISAACEKCPIIKRFLHVAPRGRGNGARSTRNRILHSAAARREFFTCVKFFSTGWIENAHESALAIKNARISAK